MSKSKKQKEKKWSAHCNGRCLEDCPYCEVEEQLRRGDDDNPKYDGL